MLISICIVILVVISNSMRSINSTSHCVLLIREMLQTSTCSYPSPIPKSLNSSNAVLSDWCLIIVIRIPIGLSRIKRLIHVHVMKILQVCERTYISDCIVANIILKGNHSSVSCISSSTTVISIILITAWRTTKCTLNLVCYPSSKVKTVEQYLLVMDT